MRTKGRRGSVSEASTMMVDFFFGTDFPVGGRREIWRGSAPRAPWGNPPRGAEARARVRPPRRRIRRSRSMARFVMSSRRGSPGVSCVGVGRDARRRAAPSGNFPAIDRYRASLARVTKTVTEEKKAWERKKWTGRGRRERGRRRTGSRGAGMRGAVAPGLFAPPGGLLDHMFACDRGRGRGEIGPSVSEPFSSPRGWKTSRCHTHGSNPVTGGTAGRETRRGARRDLRARLSIDVSGQRAREGGERKVRDGAHLRYRRVERRLIVFPARVQPRWR